MKITRWVLGLLVVGAAPVANAGAILVDHGHSRVEIGVKATVDSFTAKLDDFTVEITADEATGTITGATFGFRFVDVKTGKTSRDRQMNEWQQTEQYPGGKFTLGSLSPTGDGQYAAEGSLELHGVTKALRFPVTIATDKQLVAIDGQATLDTRDFGLPVIRKFAVLKVDPAVVVRFHLQGARSGP